MEGSLVEQITAKVAALPLGQQGRGRSLPWKICRKRGKRCGGST